MTLPDERTRAIYYTRAFLRDLLHSETRPKTIMELKRRALACLRHYPGMHELADPQKYLDAKEAEKLAKEDAKRFRAEAEEFRKSVIYKKKKKR